jgi:hypothetical protein
MREPIDFSVTKSSVSMTGGGGGGHVRDVEADVIELFCIFVSTWRSLETVAVDINEEGHVALAVLNFSATEDAALPARVPS